MAATIARLFDAHALPPCEMPTAASFWWADRLTAAILKTPSWLGDVRQRAGLQDSSPDSTVAWLAAAEILAHWPQGLNAFLDAFQQIDKHRTTSTGLGPIPFN